MKIDKSHFLCDKLKKAWLEMENGETPFLYYNYMKYVCIQTRLFSLYSPIFYYIQDDNDKVIMIAPMRQHILNGGVDTLGNVAMCDFTDILYHHDLNDLQIEECLVLLKNYIRKPFLLSRLLANSKTLYIYDKIGILHHIYQHKCVNIFLLHSIEEYYKQLSKSVRQNIRTAYNRMQRESISYDLVFAEGEKISTKLKKDTKACYNKRQLGSYFSNFSQLQRIRKKIIVNYLRHDNFSLYNNDNAVISALYINGNIAAFMAGVTDKCKNRIVIPRLAIDTNYKFYSPGYVLLIETIKYCLKNTSFRNIDLCRGTEKYKTDLGGEVYSSEFVEIR